MTFLQAVLLGIVQGVTEFLPISSSAHLVLLPHWLGWSFDPQLEFAFDVLVQLGTILAVILYFRGEIQTIAMATLGGLMRWEPFESEQARLGWLLLLATLPAALAGLLFQGFFEQWFHNPRGVSALLLATAFLLLLAERVRSTGRKGLSAVGWLDAFLVGCFQALAILPGISRSGATIAGGVMLRLERRSAARFSFLMAVPVMLGAGAVACRDLLAQRALWLYAPAILAGFIAALLVGLLSIHWLLSYLQRHSLRRFAWYCALVGVAGLLLGCSPAPVATATAAPAPALQVGVAPATHGLVQELISGSPSGGQIAITPYSSNRRLLKAVQSGGVEAGVALYRPNESTLVATPLALTSLRIIGHPQIPIEALSLQQLRAVFTGAVTDWGELSGPSGRIKVATREQGAGARALFDALVLGGMPPSPGALVLAGDDLMLEYVAGETGAIGYGWQALAGAEVKLLAVADEGGFSVPVYAFTFAEPDGQLRDWLAWLQARGPEQLPAGFQPLP